MKRLTKSRDAMVSGVCGGIAEFFEIDPTLVRAGYLIFTLFGAGSPILLYFLLAIIIPEAE